ncbi:ribosomal protein L13 [Acrasis kona]|uniref:Ribosomal protein L13 n=1 Tax=Acrasis kona TaxID=1008807 RepID=A0AAW2ZSN0_9EUKA
MVKSNNIVPNAHFNKQWQYRVRLNFNQPAKRKARKTARVARAQKLFPRPTDSLAPAVRIATVKHNRRLRAGRGFTPAELKAAGLTPAFARTIGIRVDIRRQNLSEEGLQQNVDRLKQYLSKLVLFPRDSKKPKKGPLADSTGDALKNVQQLNKVVLPVVNDWSDPAPRVIEKEERKKRAYKELRYARKDVRLVGHRFKKARAAREEKQSTQGSKGKKE